MDSQGVMFYIYVNSDSSLRYHEAMDGVDVFHYYLVNSGGTWARQGGDIKRGDTILGDWLISVPGPWESSSSASNISQNGTTFNVTYSPDNNRPGTS